MLIDPEGRRLLAAGRHADARRHFSLLLASEPEQPGHSLGLSFALAALDRLSEADVALAHAESLAPDDTDLLAARASLHEQLGDEGAAMQTWLDLLARDPDHLPAAHNLGVQLYRLGYFAEAVQQHRETARRHPRSAATWRDLGQALLALGETGAAIEALRQANRLAPQDRDNRFALGLALLRAERWAEGWPLYEARWRPDETPPGLPGIARWQGEDLTDRHLLVFAEQGYGDSLMFCRYLAIFASEAARLTVIVPAPLLALLAHSLPGMDIRSSAAGIDDVAYTVMLGQLPLFALARGITRPPEQFPYLCASPTARANIAAWPVDGGIGLVWRGNPANPADRQRSTSLEKFLHLQIPTPAPLFSLQPAPSAAEKQLLEQAGIQDLSDLLVDFDSTAALLERLAGLNTVDTAAAHLAGALGRPFRLFERAESEWRWGVRHALTPWYPSCTRHPVPLHAPTP